jgi:histidinol-phosphate/aromatic aminotransferase/cobyric acid decarboxylase-like protein
VPGEANSVLVRPPMNALALARHLQGDGMVVRTYGGNPRMAPWLRITVRSPEENSRLLAGIGTFKG